ncbi:hypothetical protein ASD11_02950 [Aeromicrobium sp. Root495]|uniref:hypothetical protein n=1 Tax=Aeromicrobium sp. Root495 TaxID=1736550 RepID=UPI000700EBE8|nr:hypothetical protein [Aeromicrobium sp. Root495]KQY58629.1 hypothetical protein ASD11_02950 [Aeromicrobium sp. Root495]RYI99216.1 MAG: hypothetical protein EON52_26390 [Actinomycetales bacterium]
MTWDAHHRRTTVLREVLAAAEQRRDETTPDDLLDSVDGARDVFATDVDLLLSLHMTWTQRLSGALDIALGDGTDDPETAVIEAWTRAATAAPTLRRLLDDAEEVPELAAPLAQECVVLARSAGSRGDLLQAGERLRVRGREAVMVEHAHEPHESRGLMARLREALAA